MTFLELIRDVAPVNCGVDIAHGKVAEIIYWREREGEEMFSHEHFSGYGEHACRERAIALYIPYAAGSAIGTDYLNLIELVICYHRQNEHGEDWSERIKILEKGLSNEEIEFAQKGWWGG